MDIIYKLSCGPAWFIRHNLIFTIIGCIFSYRLFVQRSQNPTLDLIGLIFVSLCSLGLIIFGKSTYLEFHSDSIIYRQPFRPPITLLATDITSATFSQNLFNRIQNTKNLQIVWGSQSIVISDLSPSLITIALDHLTRLGISTTQSR